MRVRFLEGFVDINHANSDCLQFLADIYVWPWSSRSSLFRWLTWLVCFYVSWIQLLWGWSLCLRTALVMFAGVYVGTNALNSYWIRCSKKANFCICEFIYSSISQIAWHAFCMWYIFLTSWTKSEGHFAQTFPKYYCKTEAFDGGSSNHPRVSSTLFKFLRFWVRQDKQNKLLSFWVLLENSIHLSWGLVLWTVDLCMALTFL